MDVLFDICKIAAVFACLIGGTRRLGMAGALGLGVCVFALLSGLPPAGYVLASRRVFTSGQFWFLEAIVLCLLTFTEVFVRSGLCDRMVRGLETYIVSARARLVVFPMLLALLPVPGGALLSCPMVDSASKSITGLNQERLAVINYWFRHCLETVWPFYPGFILVCAMGDVDVFTLPVQMLPMPVLTLCGGWFFLLRHISLSAPHVPGDTSPRELLIGGLPLAVTIGCAIASLVLGKATGASIFKDWAFVFAPIAGMLCCLGLSGRGPSLVWQCMRSPRVSPMLLLLIAVFYFKEFLAETGFIDPFVAFTQAYDLLPLVFVIIPFMAGLALGLYAGFVALSFPVLMPMLAADPALWNERLPYIVLAVIAGQVGQLLSPTHACFMFSCEYFKARLGTTWRSLLPPATLVMAGGIAWFFIRTHA